jgi:hypothetical protein
MIHLSGCHGAANTNDSLSAVRRLTGCGKPYVGLRQRRWLGTKNLSCHCCLDRQCTPPHFLITLASLKSPVAGLPERDRADMTFFARLVPHHRTVFRLLSVTESR